MLVMLLLMKERVADSAAGCFARMSDVPAEEQIVVPQAEANGAAGNVRVLPPAATQDAGAIVPE